MIEFEYRFKPERSEYQPVLVEKEVEYLYKASYGYWSIIASNIKAKKVREQIEMHTRNGDVLNAPVLYHNLRKIKSLTFEN